MSFRKRNGTTVETQRKENQDKENQGTHIFELDLIRVSWLFSDATNPTTGPETAFLVDDKVVGVLTFLTFLLY